MNPKVASTERESYKFRAKKLSSVSIFLHHELTKFSTIKIIIDQYSYKMKFVRIEFNLFQNFAETLDYFYVAEFTDREIWIFNKEFCNNFFGTVINNSLPGIVRFFTFSVSSQRFIVRSVYILS